jgi:hypothetical protein
MSLGDIRGGLKQLNEFTEACKEGRVGLEALRACKTFFSVIVTSEPFYLANSHLYDDLLYDGVEQGIRGMPKKILSVEQLELLQTYVSAGHSIGDIFTRLDNESLNAVFNDLQEKVVEAYKQTFFYQKDKQFYSELGVPD